MQNLLWVRNVALVSAAAELLLGAASGGVCSSSRAQGQCVALFAGLMTQGPFLLVAWPMSRTGGSLLLSSAGWWLQAWKWGPTSSA